jgi:hypothetical protein
MNANTAKLQTASTFFMGDPSRRKTLARKDGRQPGPDVSKLASIQPGSNPYLPLALAVVRRAWPMLFFRFSKPKGDSGS